MTELLAAPVKTLLWEASPPPDDVIQEMTRYGDEQGFPTVGPDVGQFLTVAARMVNAKRIFEFGSGFGYSAAWFVEALPPTGEIVLTDYDRENLRNAEMYLDRLDFEGTARFEAGEAVSTFDATEGTFDVVLIDLDKEQYVDAFSRAAERLRDGGIVIADNMMEGPVDPESVTRALRGEEPVDPATAGIARYIDRVRSAQGFATAFVPLGSGIAVSHKRVD